MASISGVMTSVWDDMVVGLGSLAGFVVGQLSTETVALESLVTNDVIHDKKSICLYI